MRKLVGARNVADGPNLGYRGPALGIDPHRSFIDRDTDIVETEIFDVRLTAGGDQDVVHIDGPLALGQSNGDPFLVTADPDLTVEFVPIHYDFETLAREMTREGLPAEFVETIWTGW